MRVVGLAATCYGLHSLTLQSPKAMASIVRSSVRMKSGTERVAQPSGGKAMRSNPSQEHAAQLPEQIHLCLLGGFNIQGRCGWGRGCAGWLSWFGVAVEKFFQLLEIFFQRLKQVALMKGGCWV